MNPPDSTSVFAGSIPELYERYMVPLIFEPYGLDLARRVAVRQPSSVLEIAAGTGVVTRQLARALPRHVSIVATDLNQPMIEHAATVGTSRPVDWRQADAMQLPFRDKAFDLLMSVAVIEHVGSREKQRALLYEMCRVGKAFCVWTPNRWYPLEFHSLIPLLHWLPSWGANLSRAQW